MIRRLLWKWLREQQDEEWIEMDHQVVCATEEDQERLREKQREARKWMERHDTA